MLTSVAKFRCSQRQGFLVFFKRIGSKADAKCVASISGQPLFFKNSKIRQNKFHRKKIPSSVICILWALGSEMHLSHRQFNISGATHKISESSSCSLISLFLLTFTSIFYFTFTFNGTFTLMFILTFTLLISYFDSYFNFYFNFHFLFYFSHFYNWIRSGTAHKIYTFDTSMRNG